MIASAFADLGFDVDIGPLFATPEEAARQAVENDVHIVGISSLAAGHLTLVPELKAGLEKEGRGDIMIVVGGVIPPLDFDALYKAGASAIFPPGTVIAEAAGKLIDELNAAPRLCQSRRRMSSSLPEQDEDFVVASENPSDAAAQIILISGLNAFNESRVGPDPVRDPANHVCIVARDRLGRVRGGAQGVAVGAWLALDTVWVEDDFRRRGWAGACWRRRRPRGAGVAANGRSSRLSNIGAGFLFAARLCRICAHGGFSVGAYAVSAQEGAGVNGGAKGNGELAWVIFWNMDGSFKSENGCPGLRETMCGSRFGAGVAPSRNAPKAIVRV